MLNNINSPFFPVDGGNTANLPAHLRDCDGGTEVIALIPGYSKLMHQGFSTEQHATHKKSLYWQSYRHILKSLVPDAGDAADDGSIMFRDGFRFDLLFSAEEIDFV